MNQNAKGWANACLSLPGGRVGSACMEAGPGSKQAVEAVKPRTLTSNVCPRRRVR